MMSPCRTTCSPTIDVAAATVPAIRRGNTGLIVVVSILLALLLVGIIWFWPRSPVQPTADEGRQVAEAFLDQIRLGLRGPSLGIDDNGV